MNKNNLLYKQSNFLLYTGNDGTVTIASPDKDGANKCKEYIKAMTASPEVGKIYDGKVIKIMDFGSFVEIIPGKEGLLHISQIDNKRVNKVTDYLKEGDQVKVKLLKIENGKFSLSRKVLLDEKVNNTVEKVEENNPKEI